jgi:lysophospholipase L1-like esterase
MKRLRKLVRSKAPVRWVFSGDSIPHGALHTFGWRDYTELFCERLRFELGRVDDLVIKTAISGNTTRDLLASFDRRIKTVNPHVVFVMIGMNDCCRVPLDEFHSNLTRLIGRIRALRALPVLQTNCLPLPGAAPEREAPLVVFMKAVREIARKTRLPLIDHGAWWKKQIGADVFRHYAWMSDAIHPNEMGHRVFAERVFKDLGIFDPAANTCRLFHP